MSTRPGEDDEEVVGGVALGVEDLTGFDPPALAEVGQQGQLLVVEDGRHGVNGRGVDGGCVVGHGGHHTGAVGTDSLKHRPGSAESCG